MHGVPDVPSIKQINRKDAKTLSTAKAIKKFGASIVAKLPK